MALTLVTGPGAEPLTVEVAKLHLKLDDATSDEEVSRWISAAWGLVETMTERKLVEQTWDLKLDRFPCGSIWLPFPPVTSVTSITYVDTAGDTQTWSSSDYTTDLPAGPKAYPARIVPAYQEVYPQTRDVINAVTVRFVCGYDASETELPKELEQAMLLLMGHWDQHREAVLVGAVSKPIELAFESLCWPFKAFVPDMEWS